jgi:hypothetical protein
MPNRGEQKLPKLFKLGKYNIFFWSNENNEPVHIHIAKGRAIKYATKLWLVRNGGFVVAHNKGKIPQHELKDMMNVLSMYYLYICSEWKKYFKTEDIRFYC